MMRGSGQGMAGFDKQEEQYVQTASDQGRGMGRPCDQSLGAESPKMGQDVVVEASWRYRPGSES